MKRKSIRFQGFDWTELLQLRYIAKKWPKIPKDFKYEKDTWETDQANAYMIKTYLNSLGSCGPVDPKEAKLACKYIRKFCLALSKCKADYAWPVYLGMSKIEHDDVLLVWVRNNLEYMWT